MYDNVNINKNKNGYENKTQQQQQKKNPINYIPLQNIIFKFFLKHLFQYFPLFIVNFARKYISNNDSFRRMSDNLDLKGLGQESYLESEDVLFSN